jgi:hypothetical protein
MADPKEIAKVSNQVLAGIGGVVVGTYLGPAGAEGVNRAAGGVDRLIDIAAPGAPAAKPAAVISQPSVPRKESVMPPNSTAMNDPDGERALRFLSQRGWSADDLTQLISRASVGAEPLGGAEPPIPEVAVSAGSNPPRLPAGVSMEDVDYWLRALSWEEAVLHPALRRQYLANLRAAVEAASTPGVTPEDIAFWIHVFRTPQLPDAQRRDCRRNILEGLRALGVLEASVVKPLGSTA